MQISLTKDELQSFVSTQLNHFFPDKFRLEGSDVDYAFDMALSRLEYCFSFVSYRGYQIDGLPNFNHLHSDQYAQFIWLLSNSLWRVSTNEPLCNKLFSLNKTLNSLCCMYNTELPDVFMFLHCVGTVIGKAQIDNFFVAAHNTTVGAQKFVYPKIGKGFGILSGASIIGDCTVGEGVSVGARSFVYQKNISDNHVVFTNEEGKLCMKLHEKPPYTQQYFNVPISTNLPKMNW